MSKEEFLKIQTCILKVNIHCEGCKGKVKKILQKIEGVYKINIDSEQGKVTVSGNVEPETLIKKLGKSGKHAELWGPPQKQNQNQQQQQQQQNNQLKNLQLLDNNNGKGGNNKGQKGKSDNQQQPKTGGKQGQNPNQLQQMKSLQDLKMAQFKDNPRMPFGKDAAKHNLPEEDDITDDEYEDDADEFDDDDEDESEDDDMDVAPHLPLNKMKPMMGKGQMPNKMKIGQMQAQHVNMSHAKDTNGSRSNNNGGSSKKGVGNGNVPVQVNGGKKVGGGNGNNTPNQGGSSGGGGKSGGSPTLGGKSGNCGNNGGPLNKNGKNAPAGNVGSGGDNFSTNNGIGGLKKGGGGMNDGVQGLPKASNVFPGLSVGNAGHMGTMPMMGSMGGNPMGQMGAVQGLPASSIQAGASGYFRPEGVAGNQFYQQQLAAGMLNQPVNGNEGFHPMMYARPPPAVSYMPPYPYPYPYPPPPANPPYTSSFSDENPSSCSVM